MCVKDAREKAKQKIDALYLATMPQPVSADAKQVISFEALAELAFKRRKRLWKESTYQINCRYLNNYIIPHFKDREAASITQGDVVAWYKSYGHIPETARRIVPVLSVIMAEAVEIGLIPEGSNPCHGVRRKKGKVRVRLIKDSEMVRLAKVLASCEIKYPKHVAIIRMLILTGCRKNEIFRLRWKDYRDGHLHLADSKTGPRMVFLSSPAREVLDRLNTKKSVFIFPGRSGDKPISKIDKFWVKFREEADITDVRLHDFRHNYASVAIRNNESLSIISRLLGHNDQESTTRYAHLVDDMMHEAVAKISASISGQKETK